MFYLWFDNKTKEQKTVANFMDVGKVVRDLMTSFVLLVKNNYFW